MIRGSDLAGNHTPLIYEYLGFHTCFQEIHLEGSEVQAGIKGVKWWICDLFTLRSISLTSVMPNGMNSTKKAACSKMVLKEAVQLLKTTIGTNTKARPKARSNSRPNRRNTPFRKKSTIS